MLRIDLTDCHQFAPDVKEECHNSVIMFLKAYPKKYIHATEEEARKNSSILPLSQQAETITNTGTLVLK